MTIPGSTDSLPGARGERRSRLAAWAMVLLASLYALWLGRAEEVLSPGISLRTDLGSHVVAIRHLVDVSLPAGRILDWSHQWFAGYPSFYFYFPLPALLIAGLSLLVPLNVAAKAVAVAAPALLPPAVYVLARSAGFGRLPSAGAVLGAAAFLSIATYQGIGGNVLASVIGEYSFALSLALALLYLAAIHQAVRGARRLPHMTLLLAATALTHVIPMALAVVGSAAALRAPAARRAVPASWLLAFALAGFWTVPFLLRAPYMGTVAWTYAPSLGLLLPGPVLAILPWTLAGAVVLWRSGKHPFVLAAMAAAGALWYLLPHPLYAHDRGIPIFHMGWYIASGLGVAVGLERSFRQGRRLQLAAWTGGVVVLAGVCILQADYVRERSRLLLTSSAPDSAAFHELARTLAALPAGRVHSEYWTKGGGALGDHLTPGRLPAFDPDIHSSIGLLRESAFTSPVYHSLLRDLSWDRASGSLGNYPVPVDTSASRRLARLRQLGIAYYVTFSAEARRWAAAQPGELREVAAHPGWTIWQVAGASLVAPVARVRAAPAELGAAGWLEGVTDTATWLLRDGRAAAGMPADVAPGSLRPVRNVRLAHRAVHFDAAVPGVPHVVRVGYFPNWRAHGADGPYLAVPGFMVVVPRQEAVTLRFETTWVEWLGRTLTLVAIGLLGAVTWRDRARTRPQE